MSLGHKPGGGISGRVNVSPKYRTGVGAMDVQT